MVRKLAQKREFSKEKLQKKRKKKRKENFKMKKSAGEEKKGDECFAYGGKATTFVD